MESGCDEEDGSSRYSSDVTLRAMVHNNNISDLEWDDNEGSVRSCYKRVRKESSPDDDREFITVGKRGKKAKIMTSPVELAPGKTYPIDSAEYTEVSITAKEVLPKQIALAKLLNNEQVPDIMKVIYKSPFKILIRLKTLDAAEKILSSESFKQKGWICKKTNEVNVSYGLIKEVDMDLDDDSIKGILECDLEILSIKRLSRRNGDGQWVKSGSIRICFKGPVLPPYVFTYGIRIKVLPFSFPVTQCSNCWRFGHIKSFCPVKKQICPKCGGEHENCETVNFRCINCKGNHMAIVKSKCPAFLREKEIRDSMVKHNCTYKMALDRIKEAKNVVASPSVFTVDEPSKSDIIAGKRYSDVVKQSVLMTDSSSSEEGKDEERISPILKSKIVKSKPKVMKSKKGKRKKVGCKPQEDVIPVSIEQNKENCEFQSGAYESTKNKKFNFRKLLEKIKEIINSNDDIGSKITFIVNYVLSEIKTFVMSFISMDVLMQLLGCINNG